MFLEITAKVNDTECTQNAMSQTTSYFYSSFVIFVRIPISFVVFFSFFRFNRCKEATSIPMLCNIILLIASKETTEKEREREIFMDSKCASAVSDTRTDSQCEAQHDSSLTPKLIAANALAAEQKKEKYG